jgi:hypothetical protein|tara:strand:- start:2585 stop:3529 length:945 start_codon:yes stop_codon:yes gene_type:complete
MSVETQENIEENVEAPIVVDAAVDDQEDVKKDESRTIVQEEQTAAPEQEGDTELESYSDNVKKRINQLTAKRKQALEEAQAAYQYAEQQKNENEQLKSRLQQLDQGYVTEYENRVKSQTAQAKKILEEANEAQDHARQAEAQSILSKLAVEEERIRVQRQRMEQENQARSAQPAQQPQQQPVQQQPKSNPADDIKLQSWLSKNEWFNADRVMTRGAQAIHEQLVLEEGFNPSTDEYYSEIDKRMRENFPHKFQEKRANVQAVTPASNGRTVKSGRKKQVQLTPGQVAFANKMRIPLEKYAQEVLKIENRKQSGK